jgi:transglutaminase-like putative cysteine protease
LRARSLPLAVATLSGAAALALSGGAGAIGAALVILGVALGDRLRLVGDWTIGHVAVLLVCGAMAFGLGVVPAFSVLLGWLACHRCIVMAGRDDARVLLLLTTLMALIGAVGTLSVALAPVLLAFALATPIAFLHTFGVRRRSLDVGVALSTLALTMAFFTLVPRLQDSLLGGFGEAAARDRFAEEVELGDEWDDPDAQALVLRATITDRAGTLQTGPSYFRGRALDRFDGRSWSQSGDIPRPSVGAWDLKSEIMLEPMEGGTVFAPPDLLYASSSRGPILQRNDNALDHGQPGRRVAYTAFSRTHPLTVIESRGRSLLQLPRLDPRIAALAESIAPGEDDPRTLAIELARHFQAGFVYNPRPRAPEGDPLTWFLLQSHEGHCEYFASGLAVLLRLRGIPARLATGFYSSEFNATGGYLAVRRGHAHAWVEVPVPGGWAVLDATPVGDLPSVEVSAWQTAVETVNSAWLSVVLDYDLQAQFEGLESLGGLVVAPRPDDTLGNQTRLGLAGAGLVVVALGLSGTVARLVIWLLARPVPTDDARMRSAFAKARAILRRKGLSPPDALPPVESAAWLRAQIGEAAAPLERLAWMLYRSRYAGEIARPEEEAACLAALRALPKRAARGASSS